MEVHDPGKLLLLGIALVGGLVLAGLGQAEGWGVVLYVVGYLTGNGRLAARGKSPVPAIGRRGGTDEDGEPF